MTTAKGLVVTAGTLAGAIVGIIELRDRLSTDPPARLEATLEARNVDPKVTLDEFSDLTKLAATPVRPPETTFVMARTTFVQTAPPGEVRPPCADGSQPPCPEQQTCPDGSQPPCPEQDTCPDGTQPPCPEQETCAEGTQPPCAEPELPVSIDRFLDPEVVEGPIIEAVKLPESASPQKQRQIKARATELLTGKPRASDGDVRQILSRTRVKLLTKEETAYRRGSGGTRPVVSIYRFPEDERDRLVPLGAVVNFDVKLEGAKGKHSEVRWTLFDARTKVRVREPWLRRRRALRLTPDAPTEKTSTEVWVPLPKAVRGPFFVRIEMFDRKGNRVAFDDSTHFR